MIFVEPTKIHQSECGHTTGISSYPCEFEELDLGVITTLRHEFEDCVIGYSGDSGIAMAVAAYVLGARIVEKHFTLNRASKGTDHVLLNPWDLERCVVISSAAVLRWAMG